MVATPLETSLEEVAADLTAGRTVSVTLEPGDSTRYELLIVPLWEHTVRLAGWSAEDEYNGLLVVRLIGGEPRESGVVLLRDIPWTVSKFCKNDWTVELLAWWFQLLATAIMERRGNYESHTTESVRVDRDSEESTNVS